MSLPSDTPEWLPKMLAEIEDENRNLLLSGKLADVGEIRGRFYITSRLMQEIEMIADQEEARARKHQEEMTDRAGKPAAN